MGERRPDGALEAEVLEVLWSSDADDLTPAEVNAAMGDGLAYTTIMTILSRLWKKGLVDRARRGRAYAYRPLLSESDLAARKLTETLEGASDRRSVLAGFVGSLPATDVEALRRMLDELDTRR